jgi:glycosyltransferase involved in cell wall biosynthesis
MSEAAAAPRMRVVILTQVFRPELGALANRIHPIARHLRDAGHGVAVATGMPNYPQGRVFPEYRGRRFMREDMDGITVIRTLSYTTARNLSKWAQLRSYLSFVPAVFWSALRAGGTDVVLVTSPPLFPVIAGIALAKLRRAKLVLDLRDLWPDEIVAVGAASEGSASVRAMRALERWAYRSAHRVACTTPAFMDTVEARGVPRERLLLLPNGADLDLFRPLPRDNAVTAGYGLGERFVVAYSGLLGLKHGLESLVEAAELLAGVPDIVLLLQGDGPARGALEELVRRKGLRNVVLAPARPIEDVPYVLARADVCVTNLLPDPYLHKIIPVKIFEYMAMGRPVVAALQGEGARVVQEAEAGLVVPPSDARAIADAILALYRDPEGRARMGESGRRHVVERYSRAATSARLEEALEELVAGG